ncbi:MAG: hypothetical protein QXT86_12205 [Archaeoglobaceae archaeon]
MKPFILMTAKTLSYIKALKERAEFTPLPKHELDRWFKLYIPAITNLNSNLSQLFYHLVVASCMKRSMELLLLYAFLRHFYFKTFQDLFNLRDFKSEQYFGIFSYYAITRGRYLQPFLKNLTNNTTYTKITGGLYEYELFYAREIEKIMRKVYDSLPKPKQECKFITDLAFKNMPVLTIIDKEDLS